MSIVKAKGNRNFKTLLGIKNFRLLWVGEGISLVGDQFYIIALPWLVLQMTGDPLAVGGVLAVAGIPRALFMLIGGALTDRFSPRKIMFASNLSRMVVVLMLALLVSSKMINIWTLYILVLLFGIADAFFYPAQNTIVPKLIKRDLLQVGNAIIQGTAQISKFLGPFLAGILIWFFSNNENVFDSNGELIPDLIGISYAFGLEAISFFVSAITLWLIKTPKPKNGDDKKPEGMVWKSIMEGLASVWNDKGLRVLFLVITTVNFLVIGPILVGIPVLSDTRFANGEMIFGSVISGAMSFGIIMSSFGGGNLIGTILAGTLPAIKIRPLALLLSIMGIGLMILGFNSSVIIAALICLTMGIANGYVTIIFITWLQARTPEALLGRVMSVMIFFVIGLNPISMAVSGLFNKIDTGYTFIVSGILMTVIVLLAYFSKSIRDLSEEMLNTNSN